eukprot:11222253-Lingulodinium_polyedra.AAC.1
MVYASIGFALCSNVASVAVLYCAPRQPRALFARRVSRHAQAGFSPLPRDVLPQGCDLVTADGCGGANPARWG